ncbi:MAG: hypothetical protein N2444_03505 [Methylocystis sp.]|nr:hypothetical protein [Methylocystis sp.]
MKEQLGKLLCDEPAAAHTPRGVMANQRLMAVLKEDVLKSAGKADAAIEKLKKCLESKDLLDRDKAELHSHAKKAEEEAAKESKESGKGSSKWNAFMRCANLRRPKTRRGHKELVCRPRRQEILARQYGRSVGHSAGDEQRGL